MCSNAGTRNLLLCHLVVSADRISEFSSAGTDAQTRPLCTVTTLSLRDRVLGEVEKNSFIALPRKGATAG